MLLIAICVLWYLFGIVIFLYTMWSITPGISIKDMFASLLAGLFGPIMLIWFFGYCEAEWLNKRRF
jgi:hypothetical protein